MFENAELGHKVDKPTYEQEAPLVRAALLEAQRELAAADLSVVVIVTGVGGAGKSETVNLLMEWMDARGIQTHAMREPTDEERRRPPMWRFWRELPPRGRMAISFGAWYAGPLLDHVFGRIDRPELDQALDRIVELEQMLHREGVLLVKFWLHLSRDAQKVRIKELEADPRQRWRVIKRDWKLFKRYDEYRRVGEHVLRRTGSGDAPWTHRRGDRPQVPPPDRGAGAAGRPAGSPGSGQGGAARAGAGAGPPGPPGGQRHQQPRHGPRARPGDVQGGTAPGPGQARPADPPAPQEGTLADPRVRGPRRGRQGRGDPPAHRRDGRPRLPGHLGGRPDRRGAGPPVPLAVLEAAAAHGTGRDLRPLVVRPRAGRAGRGVRPPRAVAAGLRRDQRLRGAAGRVRGDRGEVLAGDHARRSSSAGSRTGRRPRTSSTSSRRRTGGTATAGPPTRRRPAR